MNREPRLREMVRLERHKSVLPGCLRQRQAAEQTLADRLAGRLAVAELVHVEEEGGHHEYH
jgi:hypothetical protein